MEKEKVIFLNLAVKRIKNKLFKLKDSKNVKEDYKKLFVRVSNGIKRRELSSKWNKFKTALLMVEDKEDLIFLKKIFRECVLSEI